MDQSFNHIHQYCEAHSSEESTVLKQLNRYTYANVLQPRMLSGHLQGRVLSAISHLLRPQNILEIGTFTGYSAICLAEGLVPNGKLITIDVNPEIENQANYFFKEAGFENNIQLIIGDAYQVIRTLPKHFDLVFIDADKKSYSTYFDLVMEHLKPGGFILVDNVLWSGKVIDEQALHSDKDTMLLHAFNEKIKSDHRIEKVLLPIRDGLYLIRKR
jgi:caffeoyl-CoA O-methyltransferase